MDSDRSCRIEPSREDYMPRRDIREYIRSRWDARFLVNNIMGLLSKQQDPSGDVVLAIITASIRSYSKAYSGRMDRGHEEGTYEALKGYAHERVIHKGRDAESMEEFLSMVRWAESEVFGFISASECDTKPNASFPMDCLGEEGLAIVKNGAWERFRAKLYCSDGVPEVGMLVFEDEDGLEAFSKWMDNAHPELDHQRMDDDDTKVTES